MRPRSINFIRTLLALSLFAAAPAAYSMMYRWVDHNGAVTYSDQPPPNESTVRQLTIIDRPPRMTEHEKRTLEIAGAEREKQAGDSASSSRGPSPLTGATGSEYPREITGRDRQIAPRSADRGPPAMSRFSTGQVEAEAVRDPCLRSADPRCHEKNRGAYVPYLGYSPSAARARSSELGIGASSSAGGAGAVGASVDTRSAGMTAPARRSSTWQPRQSLRDAKDLQ
jgi:uncharacterized protein DUF4124